MYHYLDDKEFESKMRRLGGEIMQELCHVLKENYDIGATFYLVGSGKRKLITQNGDQPVDLDYNLEILRCDDFNDCRYLKESARKSFNKALNAEGLHDCEDSTSSLTTKPIYFTKGNDAEFRFDVCITTRDDDNNYYRLIHKKYGYVLNDEYFWNMSPDSKDIDEKARFIRNKKRWNSLSEEYLKIKNMYLMRNDHDHPSFVCYKEAINNVYNFLRLL